MDDREGLTRRFEANRTRLRGVAYRMLGSLHEAEDAVQEAWLRLNRSETDAVDNLDGWLTTVLSRVCLDMLRSRKARREESIGASAAEPSSLSTRTPIRKAKPCSRTRWASRCSSCSTR